MSTIHPAISTFCMVGVNHWDTNIEVRERFSLSAAQKKMLIEGARREGINSLFALSTCNRSEIIARGASPQELTRLLITYSNTTLDEFHTYGYEKQGQKAVEHLFRVACGLDSQILGDLQVINQVKNAYELAAGLDAVDNELHRLMQHVFRAHKRSRSETSLGRGAATTAYAAVRFAQKTFKTLSDKNILLVGTGKIGKVTCKNLVSLGAKKVTLMNRTHDRAEFIAGRFNLETAEMDELPLQIARANLIIVATGASEPIISVEDMEPSKESKQYKVLLDLSVPRNIDPKVGKLDFVNLANMDYLADVTDKAYREREKDVPLVKNIIDTELTDYKNWLQTQKVVPTIKALTEKFEDIREKEFAFFENKIKHSDRDKVENLTRRIVNKIAAYSIEHLRDNNESEQIQQMVNDMFELETQKDDE